MNACYINIKGRVQGVGFRYHTVRKANELGIRGFVKNDPDGSVSIEAEGLEDFLKEFISWCYVGPRFSRVDHVEIREISNRNYPDFRVR
jgi:acylphosphatase